MPDDRVLTQAAREPAIDACGGRSRRAAGVGAGRMNAGRSMIGGLYELLLAQSRTLRRASADAKGEALRGPPLAPGPGGREAQRSFQARRLTDHCASIGFRTEADRTL